MLVIKAKVNKANGRLLGVSVFLSAEVIEALGIQGNTLTLDVRVEHGVIILIPQEVSSFPTFRSELVFKANENTFGARRLDALIGAGNE